MHELKILVLNSGTATPATTPKTSPAKNPSTSTADETKTKNVEKRREVTAEVVKKVRPDVIFFQEFERKDWMTFQEKNKASSRAHSYDNEWKEASVVCQTKDIEVAYAETEMSKEFKKLSLSPTSSQAVKGIIEIGSKFRNIYVSQTPFKADLSRLACCIYDERWLCVSWHGCYIGLKTDAKQDALRDILHMLIRLKKQVGHPFILGADFNMDSSFVREVVWEFREHGLKLYDVDDRYNEKLMVIVSGEIIADTAPIIHGKKEKQDGIIGHLQLELTLRTSDDSISHTLLQFDLKLIHMTDDESKQDALRLLRLQTIHMIGAWDRFTSTAEETLNADTISKLADIARDICNTLFQLNTLVLRNLIHIKYGTPEELEKLSTFIDKEKKRCDEELTQKEKDAVPDVEKAKGDFKETLSGLKSSFCEYALLLEEVKLFDEAGNPVVDFYKKNCQKNTSDE